MSTYDVAIVGAGIAGLIAAKTLLKHGVDNIIVLEARERVGGRIHCVPLKNTDDFADLGAHYVHGNKGNPVYAMASENDDILEPLDDDDERNNDDDLFLTADGHKLDTAVTDKFAEDFEKIFDKLTNNKELCYQPGKTVGDLFKEAEKQILSKSSSKLTDSQRKALVKFFTQGECLDSGVDDGLQLSAAGFYDFEECEGERFNHLKNGYSCILNRIASEIKPEIVRLQTVVEKIEYHESGCKITANSGNAQSFVINTKFTLCTLPLGCLKAKTVAFSPELPTWKQTAIESLGYGTIDRLLFFSQFRWWPAAVTSFATYILWTDEAKASFKPSAQNPALYENPEDMLWYHHLFGFEVEPTVDTPIFVGFISGRWAQVVEKLPDQEILAVVGELITKIVAPHFGNRPKAPVGMLRSKWALDPYSRGSYSHVATGASSSMFRDLAKPLPSAEQPRLLFAGEATHDKHFSCVHGAWLSAEREVKKILAALKK